MIVLHSHKIVSFNEKDGLSKLSTVIVKPSVVDVELTKLMVGTSVVDEELSTAVVIPSVVNVELSTVVERPVVYADFSTVVVGPSVVDKKTVYCGFGTYCCRCKNV